MSEYWKDHFDNASLDTDLFGTSVDTTDESAPDYANAGGTGDRSVLVTPTMNLNRTGALSALVQGTLADVLYFWGEANTGKYIRFYFNGASKLITEAKWYQDLTTSHGTWKWQGSNNGTDWTDIGSAFTLGGFTTQTITTLSANTTYYKYYQMVGTGGNTSSACYLREAEFNIQDSVTAAVVESGSSLTVTVSAALGNAGLVYLKRGLNQTETAIYQHKVKLGPGYGHASLLSLLQSPGTSLAVGDGTTINGQFRIRVNQTFATTGDTPGRVYITYWATNGSAILWSGTSWGTDSNPAFTGTPGEWYVVQFIHDTTRWKVVILNGAGTQELAHTPWVDFSALKADYNNLYLMWGQPYTEWYYGTIESDWFRFGNYPETVAFYGGGNNSGARLGRCISHDDGHSYVRDPQAGVIQGSAFEAGESIVYVNPSYFVQDGETLYAFVSAAPASGVWQVSVFSSTDGGLTWTRAGTAPKLTVGGSGAWDENSAYFPVVVKDENAADANKRWKMYYAGLSDDGKYRLGVAYAANPTDTFTKDENNPIVALGEAGSFDAAGLLPNSIFADGATLRLYYGGRDADGFWQTGELVSTDWVTWERVSTSPIIARRSSVTTSISAQSGTSLTVGDSSLFVADEWVFLSNSNESAYEMNRIQTIVDGTHITLAKTPATSYVSGKIKSAYFGSLTTGFSEKVGSTYRHVMTAFQQRDTAAYTFEMTGYLEGSAHDTFTFDRTDSPLLPLGLANGWDNISAENMRRITTPIMLELGQDIERQAMIPFEFSGADWVERVAWIPVEWSSPVFGPQARLPLEWTGGLKREAHIPVEYLPQRDVSRGVYLPIAFDTGVGRSALVPLWYDGAYEVVRSALMPLDWEAALERGAAIPVEFAAGVIMRAVLIPLDYDTGLVRAALIPVEYVGDNVVIRQVRVPAEWSTYVQRGVPVPVEYTGQVMAITHRRNVLRKLSESFRHERMVIPDAVFTAFRHQRSIKQLIGGSMRHVRRVIPQMIVALHSQDIQMPDATVEKS